MKNEPMKSEAHNKLVGKTRALITTLGGPFLARCRGFCPVSLHCNRNPKQISPGQMSRLRSVDLINSTRHHSQSHRYTLQLMVIWAPLKTNILANITKFFPPKASIKTNFSLCMPHTSHVIYYSYQMSSRGKDDICIRLIPGLRTGLEALMHRAHKIYLHVRERPSSKSFWPPKRSVICVSEASGSTEIRTHRSQEVSIRT